MMYHDNYTQHQINKHQQLKDCLLVRLHLIKSNFSKMTFKEKNEVEIQSLETEMQLAKADNEIKRLSNNYCNEVLEKEYQYEAYQNPNGNI